MTDNKSFKFSKTAQEKLSDFSKMIASGHEPFEKPAIHEVVENIMIERNKKVDSLIFGEIQKIAKENGIDTKIVINEKTIVSALEKQIPKKPVTPWDSISKIPECPYCYHRLLKGQKYCNECGQALDWSDTE